jgi:4-amino-4-deoxy-L-arabinose transferase-like glycosyltransferase
MGVTASVSEAGGSPAAWAVSRMTPGSVPGRRIASARWVRPHAVPGHWPLPAGQAHYWLVDTAAGRIEEQRDRAGRDSPAVPEFAGRSVAAVAVALAALLTAFSGRYGYHRDELYFLACGRHLAWGYPDQPPLVPLIARLMSDLAPASLVVLRLPSVLASAALVLLTGLIARELGAGRTAQALAAVCVAAAPLVIGAGHLLSTTTFGLPAWALVSWLVLRILRTGNSRLWLTVGVATGAGLLDSDLIAFLLAAVIVGLAVAGPRWPFRSPWLYAGGALALVIWAPYLAWQAGHGWPELTVAASIASGGSGTSAPRWAILPYQFALVGAWLSPVWVTGLVRLLRDDTLRWCRSFGAAFFVLVVVFTITGGKPYYLGGLYPLLFAGGAQPAVDWASQGRARMRAGLLAAATALTLTAVAVTLPVVPAADLHRTPIVALNYDAGETIGWPAYVREIAAVYRSLPSGERSRAILLGSNYGESGAIDHFGPAYGLPAAYGVHNAFWYWGPPPATATVAVAIGFRSSSLTPVCGSLRLAAHLSNHVGVSDDEQGAPVWICSALRSSWQEAWPRLRNLG